MKVVVDRAIPFLQGVLEPFAEVIYLDGKAFTKEIVKDADALINGLPVQRLHYLGTDMATCFIKDIVDAMDDEMFELYLRYHFSICERPDMVGATHHMLDILRKEQTR